MGGVVCEAEGDACAVAETDEVGAVDLQVIENGGEVGGVLFDGEFEGTDVALALASGVVGEHAVLVAQGAGVAGPVQGALGHSVEKNDNGFGVVVVLKPVGFVENVAAVGGD